MKLLVCFCIFIAFRTAASIDSSFSNIFESNTHESRSEAIVSEATLFRDEGAERHSHGSEPVSNSPSSQAVSETSDARSDEQYVDVVSRKELNENSTVNDSNENSANDTSTYHSTETLEEIFSTGANDSTSNDSAFSGGSTKHGRISTAFSTPSSESNETSSVPDEEEKVIIGVAPEVHNVSSTTALPKTILAKSLEFIKDTYTLSILIPVAAGIIFASTIIVFISMCRCIQRRCRRRRFRKKVQLPDSVKNLRPSDRARLLAESSDEEF